MILVSPFRYRYRYRTARIAHYVPHPQILSVQRGDLTIREYLDAKRRIHKIRGGRRVNASTPHLSP